MTINRSLLMRVVVLLSFMATLTVISTRHKADSTGTCSGQTIIIPFNDVSPSNIFFCAIASAYFTGLTNGTGPDSFSPADPVSRQQMAAFATRTLDQSLRRGSRRAALDQWWTTQSGNNLGLTTLPDSPRLLKSDGTDIWVACINNDIVLRVRASDGRVLETWTGALEAWGVLVAMGKIFVIGATGPGQLFQIDPTQPAGAVTTLTSSLGGFPQSIAYDGERIWTANRFSVSIITLNPLTVNNVPGFNFAVGLVYDGNNIWVTELTTNKLHKLDSNGAIIESIDVGASPHHPAFDGTNIWVPNQTDDTVTVMRAVGPLAGTVLATLGGNGLNRPFQAAFDGERILVTNFFGDSVSLWKASDFTPIGNFSTGVGSAPFGACSDGVNFWISLNGTFKLARF